MTCIASIFNKHWIAIAADSVATVLTDNWPKFFNADKIFELSPHVWVAVYWLADFMWIPMEIIFNDLLLKLGKKDPEDLPRCLEIFLNILKEKEYIPSFGLDKLCDRIYNIIKGNLKTQITKMKLNFEKIDEKEVKIISKNALDEIEININDMPKLPDLVGVDLELIKNINEFNDKNFDLFFDKHFSSFVDKTDASTKQLKFIFDFIVKHPIDETKTWIVFFGYWKQEIFPSLLAIELYYKLWKKIIYNNVETINNWAKFGARAFAQDDVIETLISWMNRYMQNDILNKMDKKLTFLNKIDIIKVHTELNGIINNQKSENAKWLVDAVISIYPDELPVVAETLVNISSFKKRISMKEVETIGGPIDVAIVTKLNWFSRVKKKNYLNLNK